MNPSPADPPAPYQVFPSNADPNERQLCKILPGSRLLCGAGCGVALPDLHMHIWFPGIEYPTGVCSEACAGRAIAKRAPRAPDATAA